MRRALRIALFASLAPLLWLGCNARGLGQGGDLRDDSCDDGTLPTCQMVPPECGADEILAYQDNCFVCVSPQTCEPWGSGACTSDAECRPEEWCDPCGASSCPTCTDCVPACRPHGCPTEPVAVCRMVRPDCHGGVSVVQDGCWVCVTPDSCSPMTRDDSCDDGTEPPEGPQEPPTCGEWEILAYQQGGFACVNPATCAPWGQAGCSSDAQCEPHEYCNPCASGSCPMCEDCVAGCTHHGCPTESQVLCNMIRPDCDEGEVAIVESGCWECVSLTTCE